MELNAGQSITVEENTRILLAAIGVELNTDARNGLNAAIISAIEGAVNNPELGARVRVIAGRYEALIGIIVGVDDSQFSCFTVDLAVGLTIRLAPHELEVIA